MSLPCLRNPGDLAPLLSFLPEEAVVAELGAFAGEGTRQFLLCGRVRWLYCIDRWAGGYDSNDQASGADMVEAERVFDLLCDRRLIKVRTDTITAARVAHPDSFDLVYIDANHQYEPVYEDIQAWVPLLKRSGGLIAGHDYTDPGHPGVRRAVDEIFGSPDIVFPDSSWAKWIQF